MRLISQAQLAAVLSRLHEVDGIASFVATLPNVEHVDVLPFHRLGTAKYERLGIPFPLARTRPPDPELLKRVHAQFRAHGIRSS
jgi:pyruvate formate lyase activating enzyme